jgi:hypothetical protein
VSVHERLAELANHPGDEQSAVREWDEDGHVRRHPVGAAWSVRTPVAADHRLGLGYPDDDRGLRHVVSP